MSTISEAAKDFAETVATKYCNAEHSLDAFEDLPRLVQSLLDSQKLELAYKDLDLQVGGGWKPMDEAPHDGVVVEGLYDCGPVLIRWAERRQCMLAGVGGDNGYFGPGWEDDFNHLIMDAPMAWREEDWEDKTQATITELRAACAELSFRHLGSCDGLLLEFPDGTKLNPNIPEDGYALANRIKNALSSHGESILSEIAQLKVANSRLATIANDQCDKTILRAELSALRARTEAVENKNTEVAKLIDESMELCRKHGIPVPASLFQAQAAAALASQPPQEGDKAPS